MGPELVGIGELSRTEIASVRAFAGVNADMSSQICHLNETHLAVLTTERFLAGMQAHVRLQVMISGELLTADSAVVGLLAGMRAGMILQYVFVVERFIAIFTHVFLGRTLIGFILCGVQWRRCRKGR